ncbi:hypothetical protein P0R31_35175 [Bradyrhizobium yuanmingense]|nr:hypothetical protein [Bradyrhizobium yuanmingense]
MAITSHRSLEEVERYARRSEGRVGIRNVKAQMKNIMCPTQWNGGTARRKIDERSERSKGWRSGQNKTANSYTIEISI